MRITPFKYALDANIFVLKNFDNVVRLVLVYTLISTLLYVTDATNIDQKLHLGLDDIINVQFVLALLAQQFLFIMYIVPYIQYAYAKHQNPNTDARPSVQMSVSWNTYKSAYFIATLKIIFWTIIAFVVLFMPLLIFVFFDPMTSVFRIIIAVICVGTILIFSLITALRLQMAAIAAALGQDARITYAWEITKEHKGKLFLLLVSNVIFVLLWYGASELVSLPFATADSLWANIFGTFIEFLVVCIGTITATHSMMLFFTARQDSIENAKKYTV